MKSLYIHIGWRKTGSSAIQSFLTSAMENDKLDGIDVPPIGIRRQKLVAADNPIAHHDLGDYSRTDRWMEAWDEFEAYVKESDSDRFLLSSELFSAFFLKAPEMLPALSKRLTAFGRIVLLFWVRRQDLYMTSLRVQNMKHGSTGYPFSTQPNNFPLHADYLHVTDLIRRHIPNAELEPRLYSKSGNILEVFCSAIGVNSSIVSSYEPKIVNSSVSPEMYRYQANINVLLKERDVNPPPIHAGLLQAWRFLPEHFRSGTATPMSYQERHSIIDHFSERNATFCAQFGLDVNYFRPSQSEIESETAYNIPDAVSSEFRRAIRDALEAAKLSLNPNMYKRLKQITAAEAERNGL